MKPETGEARESATKATATKATAKYYAKAPGTRFGARRGHYFRTEASARADIEATHTIDAWVQLVREDADGWAVVAEYETATGRWTHPLVAMGLVE